MPSVLELLPYSAFRVLSSASGIFAYAAQAGSFQGCSTLFGGLAQPAPSSGAKLGSSSFSSRGESILLLPGILRILASDGDGLIAPGRGLLLSPGWVRLGGRPPLSGLFDRPSGSGGSSRFSASPRTRRWGWLRPLGLYPPHVRARPSLRGRGLLWHGVGLFTPGSLSFRPLWV